MEIEIKKFVELMDEKQYTEAASLLLNEVKKNASSKLQNYLSAENEYQLESFSVKLKEKFEEFVDIKKIENDQLLLQLISDFESSKDIVLSQEQRKIIKDDLSLKLKKMDEEEKHEWLESLFKLTYASIHSQTEKVNDSLKKQDQHIIPYVYLKQFSFLQGTTPKVCLIEPGFHKPRRKSIKTFLTEDNIFTIVSTDKEVAYALEDYSSIIETQYPQILNELENNKRLCSNSQTYLVMVVANLLVRSMPFRLHIEGVLNSEDRIHFLKYLSRHVPGIDEKYFEIPTHDLINRASVILMNQFNLEIAQLNFIFLQAKEGDHWYTTDSPVIIENIDIDWFNFNTEIYFPLSPNYLVYIHNPKTLKSDYPFKQYKGEVVYHASETEMEYINKKCFDNFYKWVICPRDMDFDFSKE
ncbi:hypothetical protein FAES_pFAES01137 [Sporocytophaga myxococcoides]|uniref:DUF4238 domain-containing protein n=1 Tax=Sporocytophaga myxococcoides TaxID=153721 RepID=A0A098LGG3_9BACT|nr:DUF4238 domain-containing protein [Sporocytophaga myxococcoides]GAL86055.1 hypothetical protein FAES_pFAES01137 [Sporocytophaga myxococcoides]